MRAVEGKRVGEGGDAVETATGVELQHEHMHGRVMMDMDAGHAPCLLAMSYLRDGGCDSGNR